MVSPSAIEIALALIFRTGRVLVARRSRGSLAGKWEFPGGKIESGETWEDAVIRECLEELGVRVQARGRLGSVEHTYPSLHVRLNLVICGIAENQEPRPLAADALAWVTPGELGQWDIPEANHEIIRRLHEGPFPSG